MRLSISASMLGPAVDFHFLIHQNLKGDAASPQASADHLGEGRFVRIFNHRKGERIISGPAQQEGGVRGLPSNVRVAENVDHHKTFVAMSIVHGLGTFGSGATRTTPARGKIDQKA